MKKNSRNKKNKKLASDSSCFLNQDLDKTVNKTLEKALKFVEGLNKNGEKSEGNEYEQFFKDVMTDEKYNKNRQNALDVIKELNLKSMSLDEQMSVLIKSKIKAENLMQKSEEKLYKLMSNYQKFKNTPDLDEEQTCEVLFKDIMDKKKVQDMLNETKQEKLKSGYYGRNDPKNSQ